MFDTLGSLNRHREILRQADQRRQGSEVDSPRDHPKPLDRIRLLVEEQINSIVSPQRRRVRREELSERSTVSGEQ